MTRDAQNEATAYNSMDDEGGLSISRIVTTIRERARIVWAAVALCLLVACAAIIIPPPLYTITVIAYPSQTSQDKSLGSTLSALAGPLAGLIGSGATSDVQPFDLYMELIVSKRTSERLIKEDPEILQRIFYKEWDPVAKTFHPTHEILPTIQRAFNYVFGLPTYQPPSAARLSQWMSDNLSITPVNSTSMQQIQFTTPFPKFGIRFLKEMNEQADAIIREEATRLTDAQISYLEGKLAQTQTVDYRQTLLSLLSAQETTRMSINKDLPYASVVLQSSFSSDLPTSPNPPVLIAVAVFAGLVLGAIGAITAAMLWPQGRTRYTPSRYWLVTKYRAAMWSITMPHKGSSQPAE